MSKNTPDEQKHSARTTDEEDSDIIIADDDAEIITDGGLLECPDCDESFVRESALNAHQFFAGHGGLR